jgi:hypothetical protein
MPHHAFHQQRVELVKLCGVVDYAAHFGFHSVPARKRRNPAIGFSSIGVLSERFLRSRARRRWCYHCQKCSCRQICHEHFLFLVYRAASASPAIERLSACASVRSCRNAFQVHRLEAAIVLDGLICDAFTAVEGYELGARATSLTCTNRSGPPRSSTMNPNPLAGS